MADVQRFLRPNTPERYRIDPASPVTNPISFGDLTGWDSTNLWAIRHTAGQGLKFLGVAMGRHPVSSNIDHTTVPMETDIVVQDRGIFFFNTTAAETYAHGDPVKIGADAQTIAKATQPTDQDEVIGFIWKPQDSAATTGAAGVSVQVAIMRRFPFFTIDVTAAGGDASLPAMLN